MVLDRLMDDNVGHCMIHVEYWRIYDGYWMIHGGRVPF